MASCFRSHSGEKSLGEKRQENAGGTNCAIDMEISIRDIITPSIHEQTKTTSISIQVHHIHTYIPAKEVPHKSSTHIT
jgi:hypothetical protein